MRGWNITPPSKGKESTPPERVWWGNNWVPGRNSCHEFPRWWGRVVYVKVKAPRARLAGKGRDYWVLVYLH